MIQEQYVSFEIAKLLKENGFHEECHCKYGKDGTIAWFSSNNGDVRTYARPTQQMAMRWLREVHNIHIALLPFHSGHSYYDVIYGEDNNGIFVRLNEVPECHNSYEEACNTAIKYCLENLI